MCGCVCECNTEGIKIVSFKLVRERVCAFVFGDGHVRQAQQGIRVPQAVRASSTRIFLVFLLQVENPTQAVAALEQELGFPVQGYAEGTVVVPQHLELNMKKLKSYLNWVLKLHAKGDEGTTLCMHTWQKCIIDSVQASFTHWQPLILSLCHTLLDACALLCLAVDPKRTHVV